MSNPELIRALEAAVAAAPDDVNLRTHLAGLLMADQRYAEAVPHYRAALDRSPKDSGLKLSLAEAYAGHGKEDVALVVVEDILRGGGKVPPKALILAARLYLKSGQLKEAARVYRQAITADPQLADASLEKELRLEPENAQETSGQEQTPLEAWRAKNKKTSQKEDPLLVMGKDPSRAEDLIEIEQPEVTFDDVGGMERLKEEIRMKIIYPLSHPELFQAYGKSIGGGIMMFGPPGCGKTYLAKATAGEVKADFISVGLHDVLDMYIGQSERNLHEIFDIARKKSPCVLFFDEVDALGASRAEMRHTSLRQVINQMLAEMDGVDTSNEGILILAATNTPWYVDQALRRPGRFDRVLFVPPPDEPAREAILRLHLQDKPAVGIDYDRLARETKEFSGADIRGAVDQAIEAKLMEAMRSSRKLSEPPPLTTSDLVTAIKKQKPTTREWFETARNYAIYANESGFYDDVLDYLKIARGPRL